MAAPHDGLELLDPRPAVLDAGRRYELRFDLDTARLTGAPTIGLLANGFPDSAAFLDSVADALRSTFGVVAVERVVKASPPVALTDDQRTRLERCDAVIAAYGH